MRVTTAFSRLLRLPGVHVREVAFGTDTVVVTVALRRRRLVCPVCGFSTAARYDHLPTPSRWRHLDLGTWKLVVEAKLRRLRCPAHGVRREAVPFARAASGHTADFEDLVGWLATTMDKSALARLVRVDWDTVGRILARVMGERLDPGRLHGLFAIGIDEIAWRKHHKYLTLVSDHASGRIVWGAEGRDIACVDGFFAEVGPEAAGRLEVVSVDMSAPFAISARKPGHAPQAVICYDPFHVVQLATKALDQVRRQSWNELRRLPDPAVARRFKGARWALLKNPENLSDDQAATLRRLRRLGGAVWRAYVLKEALRAVFAGDLGDDEVAELLDRFCAKAARSRLGPFVRLAKTVRRYRAGILAAVRLGITNARHEGLNRRVRQIISRSYGFHSAKAALALVMLTVGPIEHVLPHERTGVP